MLWRGGVTNQWWPKSENQPRIDAAFCTLYLFFWGGGVVWEEWRKLNFINSATSSPLWKTVKISHCFSRLAVEKDVMIKISFLKGKLTQIVSWKHFWRIFAFLFFCPVWKTQDISIHFLILIHRSGQTYASNNINFYQLGINGNVWTWDYFRLHQCVIKWCIF